MTIATTEATRIAANLFLSSTPLLFLL